MEHHRLKPMVEDYDKDLFNDLYEKTAILRKKLASQIDSARFGYDTDEIESWFTVKFIHAFNRYYDLPYELHKANIVQALRYFKNRILKFSYSLKNSPNCNTIDVTEIYSNLETEKPNEERQANLDKAMNYLKENLSEQAFLVLKLELNPPLYILEKLSKQNKKPKKIPSNLISEYLGFKVSYVNVLRKEISAAISRAKDDITH